MIIQTPTKIVTTDKVRIEAEIILENYPSRSEIIYIETIPEFENMLSPTADAFLTGAVLSAYKLSEKRISIPLEVSQDLADNLNIAMRILRLWYSYLPEPCAIEATFVTKLPRSSVDIRSSASFLSGGVDSMALLLDNRSKYAQDHHFSIKYCFFVYGLDVGDPNKVQRPDIFKRGLIGLDEIARKLGIKIIPVWTNLRNLLPDGQFYADMQFASLLSAVGHAFSSSIHTVFIASDNKVEYLWPHGSHPWLNSCYSGGRLVVKSGLMEKYSRLEKVKMIATDQALLDHLRVCWMMDDVAENSLNCGRCRKCVRTMLELLVVSETKNFSSFDNNEINIDLVNANPLRSEVDIEYYEELIDPLNIAGYRELSNAVKGQIEIFQQQKFKSSSLNWFVPTAFKKIFRKRKKDVDK